MDTSQGKRATIRPLYVAVAVSLAIAVTAFTGVRLWQDGQAKDAAVARVASLEGTAQRRPDSGAAPQAIALAVGNTVVNGDVIRSAPGSRLVLTRPSGIEIHVAADSEIDWQSHDGLRLKRGLVYIDTGSAAHVDDDLSVITTIGRIRHLGTRFSVRVENQQVQVMVRDGSVSVANGAFETQIGSGRQAQLDSRGVVSAREVVTDVGPWTWLEGDLPRFAVDRRNLHDVLSDISDAAGIPLRYGSAEIEAQSRQLLLHGPDLAMQPIAALQAALLTTHYTLRPPAPAGASPPQLVIESR